MPRSCITLPPAVIMIVVVTLGCGSRKTPAEPQAIAPVVDAKPTDSLVPILEFSSFLVLSNYPFAKLTLRNPTTKPIFFAGYGPTLPLQTWERLDDQGWTQCDYQSCGTGRKVETLAPGASITITTDLREYKTDDMPDSPRLKDYQRPMRVVLYYGFADNDIQHPVMSDPFSPRLQP